MLLKLRYLKTILSFCIALLKRGIKYNLLLDANHYRPEAHSANITLGLRNMSPMEQIELLAYWNSIKDCPSMTGMVVTKQPLYAFSGLRKKAFLRDLKAAGIS